MDVRRSARDFANWHRLLLATLFCLTAGSINAQSERPRLAVLLVVDQMRPDYLTRFDSLYSGGLARLQSEGFVFLNALHNHANSETGIGHATLATGCYPARHGIVGNDWYENAGTLRRYCFEDTSVSITENSSKPGRSPISLRRGTLADWLRRDNPLCKSFAIAIKDRAAIPMAGFSANGAYWYDAGSGLYVTSVYYSPIYPEWVRAFRQSRPADDYCLGEWDRILPAAAYALVGPDSVAAEGDGVHVTFPHVFVPGPHDAPDEYYEDILTTPFADHMTLRLAKVLVAGDSLGADDHVDLLAIGCSAADYIGHDFGPDSQEIMDYYLRLDRYLGEFFTFLDSTVGTGKYVVALTSDHGAARLPELQRTSGIDAGRIPSDSFKVQVAAACQRAAQALGLKQKVAQRVARGVYLDYSEAEQRGVSRENLQQAIADSLRGIWFVADAYTEAEMTASGGTPRAHLEQFRNNYFPGRSPEIAVRLRENYFLSSDQQGTSHGSCYGYDCIVPMVFWGGGVKAGQSSEQIESVDLAPTLAELIGLLPPDDLDGHSRAGLIRR